MADKSLKFSVVLSAVDQMTRVVNSAVNSTVSKLNALNRKTSDLSRNSFGLARDTFAMGTASGALLLGPLKAAADMEKLNVALRTSFQNNQKAADAAFATIRDFSAKTPFQLNEVMSSFIKLNNMGLKPDVASLTAYGNTASAMGKSLNDMVEAVTDATTGEFERLKEFGIKAKTQGDTVSFTFQGVTTKVKKNAESINNYLLSIGNTKFAGGIEAQSKTIYGQWSTLKDNAMLTAASIGNTLLPAVNELFAKITPVLDKVSAWAATHQELLGVILKGIAIFAAVNLTISGFSALFGSVMKIVSVGSRVFSILTTTIGFVSKAVMFLGRAMLANPILLVIAAIAVAAYLIIKNWDKVKAFFIRLWEGVKEVFSKVWNFIKKLFLNYTPQGLIIKHWDKITAFFRNLWDGVVKIFHKAINIVKKIFWDFNPIVLIVKNFNRILDWLSGFAHKLYQAGKNIIKQIWEGIKSMVSKPVEAVKNMVKKIRDFLPFSPAKEGPFRDLHRVKIVETIAQSMKPTSMVNAMKKAVNATMAIAVNPQSRPLALTPQLAGGGATTHINYNPTISLTGGSEKDKADFLSILEGHKADIARMVQDINDRKARTKY